MFNTGAGASWADDDGDMQFGGAASPSRHESAQSFEQTSPDMQESRKSVTDAATEEGPNDGYRQQQPRREYNNDGPSRPIPEQGPFSAYVGNLPFKALEGDVADFFEGLKIEDIRLPLDYQTQRPKGFAYVKFESRDDLAQALERNQQSMGGRQIRVDVASEKKERNPGFNRRGSDRRFGGRGSRNGEYNRPPTLDDSSQGEPRGERKKISLLPRTKSQMESDSQPQGGSNIFGGAKPRDEKAYLERRKSQQKERKEYQRSASGGKRGGRGSDERWGRQNSGEPRARTSSQDKPRGRKNSAEGGHKKAVAPKTHQVEVSKTKVVNHFSALGLSDDSSDEE